MTGWTDHQGTAVAFDRDGVDTDQIIPARFMSTPRSQGYGGFLLHDLRHDAEGNPKSDFPLNRHPEATVLVTGRNFGSGSSREAAVYALVDSGIRAVVAASFGDIFASNAVNNGLLPARVGPDGIEALIATLGDGTAEAVVDLACSTLKVGNVVLCFDLDPVWREKLINGWDDIDLTLKHREEIASHREGIEAHDPWRLPAPAGAKGDCPLQ